MSTLLTSPQPQKSSSHISVILFQGSNYVPISTAVTEASLITWDASWNRRTSLLQDLEGKRCSALQIRGCLYNWTRPCVHLPCCHQLRFSWHEVRFGLCLPAAPWAPQSSSGSGLWVHTAIADGLPWCPQDYFEPKTLYVEIILYVNNHFLPLSALRHAHSFDQVSMANSAPTLPTVWVSPDPCTSSGGVQDQEIWPMGVVQGAWTFQQFHWVHQEAFPSSRALIPSLEKCLAPTYSSPHPVLYTQVSNTTSILGVLDLRVVLYDSSKVILEKHLKLDLEVLALLSYCRLWSLRWLILNTSCLYNYRHQMQKKCRENAWKIILSQD